MACIAISVANETRMEGGKMVPEPGKYEPNPFFGVNAAISNNAVAGSSSTSLMY